MLYKLFRFLPKSIRRFIERPFLISGAICDPNGFWKLKLMFENAGIDKKYQYMFLPEKEWEIFCDCWANVWLITDIARFSDMEVYAFEPNPQAVRFLNKKYSDDKNVHIIPKAVWNTNWIIDFFVKDWELFDCGATTCEEMAKNDNHWKKISVEMIKLVDYLKIIVKEHGYIYLLKLDIEWSEFDVINSIIDEKLYKKITYIVVETHERFFKNWKVMLKNVKDKISEKK